MRHGAGRNPALLIKLSFPGRPSADLSQFTGNEKGEFAGHKFVVDNQVKEADAWFIFEDVYASDHACSVPNINIHFLGAETSWSPVKFFRESYFPFFQQFSKVHICYPNELSHSSFQPPFLPWMINANHGTIFSPHHRDLKYFQKLEMIPKVRPLSIICSDQTWTEGHQLRFRFASFLKKQLGEDIEWFGNGIQEVDEKWDALAPFERTIVLENSSAGGVFTEKILDPFLSLTLPIYWGAPDISHFLPVPQRLQLNIRDFRGSLSRIQELMRHPIRPEESASLLAGKKKVTSELHFLSRIAGIAEQHSRSNATPSKLYDLSPRESFQPESLSENWLRSLAKGFFANHRRVDHSVGRNRI